MSDLVTVPATAADKPRKGAPRVVNYSLRPAKNIERKMMGEAFARLAPLCPLADYQYVGFGSEFFNDFSLYHQTLGLRNMTSIESDTGRIDRCKFNRPYKCIRVVHGLSSDVLPQLRWNRRSIVWLDYTKKLDKTAIADVRFLVSAIRSGSLIVWSFNAHAWGGSHDEDTNEKVEAADWPKKRLEKLRSLFGNSRSFDTLTGTELPGWGLAAVFHDVLTDEIKRGLNDRNAAETQADRMEFRQCFHFRYADGQKMATVGGIFVKRADAATLGTNPFRGLSFIRDGVDGLEIQPPALTGREVRYLNRVLPHKKPAKPVWLAESELANYRDIYRYYPVFAESEL